MKDPFENVSIGSREAFDAESDTLDIVKVESNRGPQALALPTSIRKKLNQEGLLVAADLQHAVREITKLQEEIDETVTEAREMGLSWATIGWCVGLTAEGARKKWSEPDEL